MICRSALVIAVLFAVAGCSDDFYRRDADRQVKRILDEQERTTLRYTPKVEAPVTDDAPPTKKAYRKLPTTEIPDLITDVASRMKPAPRTRQLGPPANVVAAGTDVLEQYTSVEVARAFVRDRYDLGPSASMGNALRLGLFESIAYAVENSREYQTRMEQLYTTALDVTLQRHLFTPRPFARTSYGYTGGQRGVNYRSALVATGEAGVRQRLPLGGEIIASGIVRFVDELNENASNGETATVALNGSIPFLRGAGFVNLEPLIQSERRVVYAIRDFESYRRNFAIRIASAYFGLIAQQQAIKNGYVSYQSRVDLLDRTAALFAAGKITILEVQRAQQTVLQARDRIDNSIESYENAVDRFKLLIGMPMGDEIEPVAMQVDVPVPRVDANLANALARQYRLDLQTTRDQVDDARRRVQVARNGLLPDLDLDFGTDVGNRAGDPASDVRADTVTYDATLTLDLPIDRLAERNQYRTALIGLEQARRDVLQREDEVASEVRSSIRAIRSAIVTLELQRLGIENAQNRVEYANELLTSGRQTDSRDVVEAQNELLAAQDRYEQARAEVQVAILSYLRDTGVLRLDPESGELGLAMDLRPTKAESERDRPATRPTDAPPADTIEKSTPTPLPLDATDAGE